MKIRHRRESEILKALGHPVRLQIVEIIIGLRKDECNVTEIQKRLSIPQSTISQHLQILKNKGIIGGHKNGVKVCYMLIDKYAKEIMAALNK